jgi:hypothetical protein
MFSAQLHVLTGALAGQAFSLIDAPITIGRASDNLIFIEEEPVSWHHAVLTPEPDGYVLHDLDSTNGCWINGRAVTDAVLCNGDVIRVGTLEVRYEAETAPLVAVEVVPPAMFKVGDEGRALPIPPRIGPVPLTLPPRITRTPPPPMARAHEAGRQVGSHGSNQVRTLRTIAVNGHSREEIGKLAAEAGILPEALIDSINELAYETIGDIIVDTNSVPPVIEKENFEMVQKALALTT